MDQTTKKLKIGFYGGVETVTGANFILTDETGEKPLRVMVDCGLIQGSHEEEKVNYENFSYDPKTIDAVFITHAHMDHIGRLPKLVRSGFRGKIYSTPPTKEISQIAFKDGLGLIEREMKREDLPVFYEQADIDQTVSQWETVDYHQPITIGDFSIVLRDSGHILGSAMVEFTYGSKKILFTGDLGNSPSPLLPDTEKVTDASYIVMESVYGDRNHEDRSERHNQLEDVIEQTINRGGTLLIPTFSIEKTQELLFEIENMVEESAIPLVPVFLDSPMAIHVTEVYKKYQSYFNKDAREIIREGDGIFKFPQFHETLETEESKAIFHSNPRKIIMAGSGMSNGGRIIHHEKIYLPDPKNTLLLAGYQSVGTLGRIIQDGAKSVRIIGEEVPINARVVSISGYSAHKGSDDLFGFVKDTENTIKKVFVTMGEPRSSLFLVQRIRDQMGVSAYAPKLGEEIEISL
jgi:metallo-beta-lactamase family protein